MKKLLIPLFLSCLVVTGCAGNEKMLKHDAGSPVKVVQPAAASAASPVISSRVVNAIAAVVNDDVITIFEVIRETQPLIREREKKGALDEAERIRLRQIALETLIEKRLVDQKIKELNLKVSDDEVRQAMEDVKRQNNLKSNEALEAALRSQGIAFDQYRQQLQEQLERLKLVSMEVRSRIQVGETEMQAFYAANPTKYSEEDTFRARHIFFRLNEKAPADEIKAGMMKMLTVLAEARGGRDFSELAKTYSEDPAARKDGGDLGRFKKGDMLPDLEQAIMGMKPGEVSELIQTPAGLHIIKLEERIPGKLKPFDTVKAEIEETLYKKKSEERFSAWAKELRSRATVEVKDLKGLL